MPLVCVCVFMCACAHVRMCACAHVCMCVCVCVLTRPVCPARLVQSLQIRHSTSHPEEVQPSNGNAICWQFDLERILYGAHETGQVAAVVRGRI